MATQPGGSVTSRAASETRSGPPGSSSGAGATGNSSGGTAGSTHTGAKFRHGLLQLMIHTIDPLHDGEFITFPLVFCTLPPTQTQQDISPSSLPHPLSPSNINCMLYSHTHQPFKYVRTHTYRKSRCFPTTTTNNNRI